MNRPSAYLHVAGFESSGQLNYDKREVRKAMQKAGREVQRAAAALVRKKGRSKRDEYPGRGTGRLARSIRYKVSRSGFMVRVAPQKIAGQSHFYAAYLGYGVKDGPAPSSRRERRSGGWRIRPRRNYMEAALQARSGRVRALLTRALENAVN